MSRINKLLNKGEVIHPRTVQQAVVDSETGKSQKEFNTEFEMALPTKITGISISEEDYEALADKDEDMYYFILED